MKQKLFGVFFVGAFSFFVSTGITFAAIGDSCSDTNTNTNTTRSGKCVPTNVSCDSSVASSDTGCPVDEMCCFDSAKAESTSSSTPVDGSSPLDLSGYTDPAPVGDATPVSTGGNTGSGGGASCMKFGVHGVCIDINDPNQTPCNSDIMFSGVCSGESLRCCPTEAIPASVRTAIENGTIPSETLMIGSPCTLTTNEAGACITRDDCRALGTGSSDVEPCTSKGMVCCRTGTSGGLSGGSSGSAGGSPLPGSSGGGATGGGSTGGGAIGGSGSAGGSGTRPPAGATGSSKGLYIPTKADTGLSDISVTSLVQNLMKWLLYIVGFVAIIAFVISGIQYLLAGASEEMAKKAKANMQYAIIGVVVALSALIIIRAIQGVLSGAWIF